MFDLDVNAGPVHNQSGSGDERRLLRGQEGDRIDDIISGADTSQWVRFLQVFEHSLKYLSGAGRRLKVGSHCRRTKWKRCFDSSSGVRNIETMG